TAITDLLSDNFQAVFQRQLDPSYLAGIAELKNAGSQKSGQQIELRLSQTFVAAQLALQASFPTLAAKAKGWTDIPTKDQVAQAIKDGVSRHQALQRCIAQISLILTQPAWVMDALGLTRLGLDRDKLKQHIEGLGKLSGGQVWDTLETERPGKRLLGEVRAK